jgi:hypothetical protein
MNEKSPESQLSVQKTRLLRMRVPLVAFLALNAALVVAVPFARSKSSNDAAQTQVAQSQPADPSQAAQPGYMATSPNKPYAGSPTDDPAQSLAARLTRKGTDPSAARELLKQDLERQAAAQREQSAWNRVAANQFADSSVGAAHISTRALSELLADGTAKFVGLVAAARTNPDESVTKLPAAQNGTVTATTRDTKPTAPSVESPAEPDSLVVFNPSDTGGEVFFLANGLAYCLQPGQSQQLAADSPWLMHFHRGDAYGNAKYSVSRGTYMFHVTRHGWELSQIPDTMNDAQPR